MIAWFSSGTSARNSVALATAVLPEGPLLYSKRCFKAPSRLYYYLKKLSHLQVGLLIIDESRKWQQVQYFSWGGILSSRILSIRHWRDCTYDMIVELNTYDWNNEHILLLWWSSFFICKPTSNYSFWTITETAFTQGLFMLMPCLNCCCTTYNLSWHFLSHFSISLCWNSNCNDLFYLRIGQRYYNLTSKWSIFASVLV